MSHVVHLGDCVAGMESLADKNIDHVICDPPYSEHVHSKSMRGAKGYRGPISEMRELGFSSITRELMDECAQQFSRIVCRWVLIFCDVESSHLWRAALHASGMEYARTMAWHKIGGTPQLTGDRPAVAFEAIVVAHQPGKKRWNGGGKPGIYSCPIALERGGNTDEKRIHTAQKPEQLMSALVADFTDPGDLVLDPFAGSGTTGVACKRLGRRFIGRELQEKYQRAAQARIDATREQLELVRTKKPRQKQEALCGDAKRAG